jgi:exoribonuclease R
METLLTEIMISQGNCGQFALKAGTQLLSLGYHDPPVQFLVSPQPGAIEGHVLAFSGLVYLFFEEFMKDIRSSNFDLQAIAKQIMLAYGFAPDFLPPVVQQLASLKTNPPQFASGGDIRDLRNLLWSSVDNDTSRDLDQIEVAERLPNGEIKVLVGIADVDSFVAKRSAIDEHAANETTTVYAGVKIFPMVPEELSTGTTSLLENADKLSVVIEFTVDAAGSRSLLTTA